MAEHVIPWWMGYLLISPLRRLTQDPQRLLCPYVKTAMTVLEIGPGMGFFSIPLAKMVGPQGRIIAVDVQKPMLDNLQKRAKKAGVADRIECRLVAPDSIKTQDLAGTVDFALAFAVVHEVPDQKRLVEEIYQALKPGGVLFMADPKSHFAKEAFEKVVALAQSLGFARAAAPEVRGRHTAVLKKNSA